jgi:hypothetical protein
MSVKNGCQGLRVGEWGETASRYRVSLRGNGNVLELVAMFIQYSEYTINH